MNYNEKYPSLNKGYNYYDAKDKGPSFGHFCILIENRFLNNKNSYYHPYTCRFDFGNRNTDKNFYFTVHDLEIYQIITDDNLDNI